MDGRVIILLVLVGLWFIQWLLEKIYAKLYTGVDHFDIDDMSVTLGHTTIFFPNIESVTKQYVLSKMAFVIGFIFGFVAYFGISYYKPLTDNTYLNIALCIVTSTITGLISYLMSIDHKTMIQTVSGERITFRLERLQFDDVKEALKIANRRERGKRTISTNDTERTKTLDDMLR